MIYPPSYALPHKLRPRHLNFLQVPHRGHASCDPLPVLPTLPGPVSPSSSQLPISLSDFTPEPIPPRTSLTPGLASEKVLAP